MPSEAPNLTEHILSGQRLERYENVFSIPKHLLSYANGHKQYMMGVSIRQHGGWWSMETAVALSRSSQKSPCICRRRLFDQSFDTVDNPSMRDV